MKNLKHLSILCLFLLLTLSFTGCSTEAKDEVVAEYNVEVIEIYRNEDGLVTNVLGLKGAAEYWNARARTKGHELVISKENSDQLEEHDIIRVRKHINTLSGEKEKYFEVIAIVSKQ